MSAPHATPAARASGERYEVIDLPPGARIFLDNAAVSPVFTLDSSRGVHRLRIEARGHASRLLLLTSSSDHVIDGHLERSH
jgi:hypothetical protein